MVGGLNEVCAIGFEVCYIQCNWKLQDSIEWSALVYIPESRIELEVMSNILNGTGLI